MVARAAGPERGGGPRRLDEVLGPALARLATSDQARAYGAWARAAGDQVAGGAHPRGYSRGTLTVECSSSVWANELTYLSGEILRRMDGIAPGHPVKRLRFMVARSSPPPESPTRTAGDVPRNPRPESPELQGARDQAQTVRDERLRAAVEALLGRPAGGSPEVPVDDNHRS